MSLFVVTYVALWVIVIVQSLVLLELLRQTAVLSERLGPEPGALVTEDGLARGTSAPPIKLADSLTGASVREPGEPGRPTLLVFLSPRCQACRTIAADLRAFAANAAAEAAVVTLCGGPREECMQLALEARIPAPFLVDADQRVSAMYRSLRTPSAVLVGADGRVRLHAIPNAISHLEALLREEGTPIGARQWLHTASEDDGPAVSVPREQVEMQRGGESV